MAPAEDKELEDGLVEVGSQLASPPSDVDELISLLDKTEQFLMKIDQSPSSSTSAALQPAMKALVANFFFNHPDEDVKVSVASCVSEITRITAPDAPYDDDLMKVIFKMIVEAFKKLDNTSSRSFLKRVSILETVARFRSCVVMLDLECDALILEMFSHFLKTIRSNHPESVFSSMAMIMTLVLEESGDISLELLSCLLDSMKDNKDVLPIARNLGEKVVRSSVAKIKSYLISNDLNDYSKLVTSIFQDNSDALEHTERNVPDALEQHTDRNVPDEIVADESELSERTVSDKLPEDPEMLQQEVASIEKVVANCPKSSRNTKTVDQSYLEDSIKIPSRRKRPRGTKEISEAPDHETKLDQSLVGSKIQIWWPHDKRFYNGIVDSFDPNTREHKIVYDDDDIEILHLKNEKYKIVEDGGEASKGKDVQEVLDSMDGEDELSSQPRIKLEINKHNQVVGDGATKFKSRLGKLVRTHIPITYRDWRVVPTTYKDDVWNEIQKKYDLPLFYKAECYKVMGSQVNMWKSKLRREHYNKHSTDVERLAHAPHNVKQEQWKEFVENEGKADAIRKRELGKANRSKIGATHTSGRVGQAQVGYNLKKQKIDNSDPTRVDVWIASHKKNDGTVPASIAPYMDQVKANAKELAEIDGENISQSQSLASDALSHVFGKDTKGRTRGVGSTISRTRIEASMPAESLLKVAQDDNNDVKGRLCHLESYVKDMNSSISSQLANINTLLSSAVGKPQSMPTRGVNSTQGASSSFDVRLHSLDDGASCYIKGFNGKVIGKGRIDATPREKVHGHTIDYEEEVVLIVDKVIDPNARVYLDRQGPVELFGDIGNGSWVVWAKSLVKRIG